MVQGTQFKPILVNDYGQGPSETVVICSGKVFFDIDAKLKSSSIDHKRVKVIRAEELAPFPVQHIESEIKKVAKDSLVYWVQEESQNQGAFQFAKLHVDRILEQLDFDEMEMGYIGRKSVHSFCTGAGVDYKK